MIPHTHELLKFDQPVTYEIKVRGKLDESWSEWFDGMSIALEGESSGSPITALSGPVADQVALRGVLVKLWDMNLTLISVNPQDV
jgi:hypothetical protein